VDILRSLCDTAHRRGCLGSPAGAANVPSCKSAPPAATAHPATPDRRSFRCPATTAHNVLEIAFISSAFLSVLTSDAAVRKQKRAECAASLCPVTRRQANAPPSRCCSNRAGGDPAHVSVAEQHAIVPYLTIPVSSSFRVRMQSITQKLMRMQKPLQSTSGGSPDEHTSSRSRTAIL
jgi:hypothetical protein